MKFFVIDDHGQDEAPLVGRNDTVGYAYIISHPPALTLIGTAPPDEVVEPTPLPEPYVEPPTPGEPAWKAIRVGDYLDSSQRKRVMKLCQQYAAIFEPLDSDPARVPAFDIELRPGVTPPKQRPRFIPASKREFVEQTIAQQLELGIIRPGDGPIASPAMVITNANGKQRLVVDYRALNACTVRDAGPIPDMQEFVHSFARRPFLAAFDLTKGYIINALPRHAPASIWRSSLQKAYTNPHV